MLGVLSVSRLVEAISNEPLLGSLAKAPLGKRSTAISDILVWLPSGLISASRSTDSVLRIVGGLPIPRSGGRKGLELLELGGWRWVWLAHTRLHLDDTAPVPRRVEFQILASRR